MDKEQPWNPSNNHQDESCGVDPLKRRVVFVDLSSSNARSINEAVGSIEDSSILIQSGVGSKELIVVLTNWVVSGVPPRGHHCGNIKQCSGISYD